MIDLETINPVAVVKFNGGEIRVREMYFPQALELFGRLEKRLVGVFATGELTTIDKGVLVLLIVRAIAGSTDDIVFILLNTTELTEDQVKTLGPTAAMRLLQAALELTLNEEVIASGKAMAARLGAAFGPNSAPPSSSSSGAATASPN